MRYAIIADIHGNLEAFREAVRGAGLAGFIRDESVNWGDAQNEYHGFEIVH